MAFEEGIKKGKTLIQRGIELHVQVSLLLDFGGV